MRHLLTILALAWFASGQASADPIADNVQADSLKSAILRKAAASERGVILAITERGSVAAETAWLLAQQVQSNRGYAPWLLVTKAAERRQILRWLKLPDDNAPVLVFLDRSGHELSRITGVRPWHVPWQPHSGIAAHFAASAD